ncbi:HVO_A0556 family zinc finger protein [Haloferax namakaokahaiae]|uniref:HVO_A0556 family zinc finger protein n=1 Tax=Haloferax namakaokahaiae TaxID=1748331 RepID=A0ABD5ZJZ3_9EURY
MSESALIFETMADDDCTYCDEGTLELRSYKDNDAIVCDDCGTPAVQVW